MKRSIGLRTLCLHALLLWALSLQLPSSASRLCVAASGQGDGSSWSSPLGNIQTAIDSSPDEVWIKGYTNGAQYSGPITLRAGVSVKGGYVGDPNLAEDLRDPAYVTTFSGNNTNCVIYASDSNITPSTVVDGLTLLNGRGRLVGNVRYGGGIYCPNGSPTISNCHILNNQARYGGGIYAGTNSSPVVQDNVIEDNLAPFGGGIYCTSGTYENNQIIGNNYLAGVSGGGVYLGPYGSAPVFRNNTVASSTVMEYGGGVYMDNTSTTVEFSGNTVSDNTAVFGGGVYVSAVCAITANEISTNHASSSGGGINCNNSSCVISNNMIIGNSSNANGGGFSGNAVLHGNVIASNTAANGGGVSSGGSMSNNTLIDNTATGNGGSVHLGNPSNAVLSNNIIVGSTPSGIYLGGWGSYSCHRNLLPGTPSDYLPAPPADCTDITGDPLFDPNNPYHLSSVSPCVDSGDDSVVQPGWLDIDGDERILYEAVDIGVDEYVDTTAPTTPIVSDDGAYTADTTQLHATWAAEDAETGVAEYQYAIGTSPSDPGTGYTVGWTSVGTDTAVTRSELSLASGTTYYFYVKARNGADLWSTVGVSDGITVAYTVATVSQALEHAVGTAVSVENRIVSTNTGEFANAFYVQDPSSPIKGIRVVWTGASVSRGQIVTVTGVKQIDDTYKEAYIQAETVTVTSTGAAPSPTMIMQQWLGGGDFQGNPGVNCPYYGGLYNKGVLLKAVGTVTAVFADQNYFYIDDGSHLNDTTHQGVYGVRVSWDCGGTGVPPIMPPPVGWYVSVTGISSSNCISTDPLKIIRVLRPRDQADIVVNSTAPPSDAQRALAFVPDGEYVDLRNRVVTAVPYSNYFYIESVDQSSGIAVVRDGAGVQPGYLVDVYGRMATWNGERVILAASVGVVGTDYQLPRILNLNNRDVTGGQFGYTPGVPDTVGLPTSGLLSRIYGTVTNTYGDGFYINDGSDIDDYGDTGVFVPYEDQPPGSYLQATGVCGTRTWYFDGYGYVDYPSRILYGPASVSANVSLSDETVTVSSAGYGLLGLPAPADNPSPGSVFDDLGSNFRLFRYDYAAGQSFSYPDDPDFGNILMANGYWLINSSGQSSFTYPARHVDDGDWWVNLPTAGIALVPNPTDGDVPWQNVRVCDGGVTINLSEALQRDWLEPTALSYSSGSYQSIDLSNPSANMLRAYSYVVYPKRNMLALLVPPPGPRTTYAVTGTVTGDGQGISGARVFCDTGSATTGGNGSYTLYVTRTGDMAISASASGYHTATQVVTVTGGGGSANFNLSASDMTLSVYSSGSINTCLGETSTVVWALVRYKSGEPVAGKSVTFSTTLGLLNGSASPRVVNTNINGVASVTMTKGTSPEEDAVVTASISSPDLSATTRVFLGCPPPSQLMAASTGSDRITLYWEGVNYASGYNIYRSLTTGGPYTKVNDSPVTTMDPGPGLVNRFIFTDDNDQNGLTEDTEYFYYVVGVLPDQSEALPSIEVSAAPEAGAIPWDTGDPVAILSAIAYRMNVDGFITACGPNGVIYDTVYFDGQNYYVEIAPSYGYVDEEAAKVVYADGTEAPLTMDFSQDPPVGYGPTDPPSGIFRKVESKADEQHDYMGVFALVTLPPSTGQQYCFVGPNQPYFSQSKDMAYIYTGGEGGGWAVDAGLQLGNTGNIGWKPFIWAKRGSQESHGKPKYPLASGVYWVTVDMYDHRDVSMLFVTPGDLGTWDQTVCLTLGTSGNRIARDYYDHDQGELLRSWISGCTFVCYVPGWRSPVGNRSATDIRFKRVNSIAQDTDFLELYGSQGWYESGSYIYGVSWGDWGANPVSLIQDTGTFVKWEEYQTRNEGRFPDDSHIMYNPQNPYFWETDIVLRTRWP